MCRCFFWKRASFAPGKWGWLCPIGRPDFGWVLRDHPSYPRELSGNLPRFQILSPIWDWYIYIFTYIYHKHQPNESRYTITVMDLMAKILYSKACQNSGSCVASGSYKLTQGSDAGAPFMGTVGVPQWGHVFIKVVNKKPIQ